MAVDVLSQLRDACKAKKWGEIGMQANSIVQKLMVQP